MKVTRKTHLLCDSELRRASSG